MAQVVERRLSGALHRVLAMERRRLSLAFFFNPAYSE